MKIKDIVNLILGNLLVIPAIILLFNSSENIIPNVIGGIVFFALYKFSFSKKGKEIVKSFIKFNVYYESFLKK